MTLPTLPAENSTAWYAHYSALDAAVRAGGDGGYPAQRAGGGEWYGPTGSYRSVGTAVPGADGELHAVPFYVGRAVTVDALGTNLNPAGSAGSVIRLGIYRAGTDGLPNQLVVDGGTADSASAGNKQVTFTATALSVGLYWLVIAPQGAAATRPTLRVINSPNYGNNLFGNTSLGDATTLGFSVTGYTGALPATFSMAGFTRRDAPCIVYVRVV